MRDAPYSVLSASRLLLQGYQVELGRENCSMTSPFGQRMKVTRHGSLLFSCPLVKPFNPETFADVGEHFHSYYSQRGKDDIVAAPLPVSSKIPLIYHNDTWELEGNILARYHKRPRRPLFSPHGTPDRLLDLDELANMRETFLEYEDSTKEHIVDNWRTSEDPCRSKGKTVLKLSSKPTGSRLEGKQSTLPVVGPKKKDMFISRQTITSAAPAVKTLQPQHFATEHVQRNFRRMLLEFGNDKDDEKSAPEAHKKAVAQQLQVLDPTTGQPYVHDMWIALPTFWIRLRYVQRDGQFSSRDQELPGIGDACFTMAVDSETQEVLVTTDNWRFSGDILLVNSGVMAFGTRILKICRSHGT